MPNSQNSLIIAKGCWAKTIIFSITYDYFRGCLLLIIDGQSFKWGNIKKKSGWKLGVHIKYLLFPNTVLDNKHSHMTKYVCTPEPLINIKIHALLCNEYLNSLCST